MLTFDFHRPADLERFARMVAELQTAGARFRVVECPHNLTITIHIGEEQE